MDEAMIPSPRDWQMQSIDAEARRICDERGWHTADDWQLVRSYLRRKAFMQEIEPYVRMKIRFLNLLPPPRLILRDDGTMEAVARPMPEEISQIDGMIADIRKRYEV
jgi:hypothetical protein